ncbi:spore coat U domain-containing protein [Rickettsiella endosymbiont of Litargus connexus]|jgi:spore coat protein U-like protein|uniref:Csu type fimbrial protein n=1 Tax=Rickettsiella endosymbiont of Litargus connexus TaxID=3066237 RepID=UPI00376EBE24
MLSSLIKFAIGFLLFLVLQDAMCVTINNTLAVMATVGGGANCTFDSTTNLKFPNYYPLTSNPDYATGTVTVTCIPNLAYDIGIDKGQSAGASEFHRLLTKQGGSQQLNYNLFQDPSHQHMYGTVIGQNTLHQIATGSAEVITIYGEIPSNQSVDAGTYLDRVTIFVTF